MGAPTERDSAGHGWTKVSAIHVQPKQCLSKREFRIVEPQTISRLEGNLRKFIADNNVALPLINLAMQLRDVVLPPGFRMPTPIIPDRWACARHLEIK